jgi:RNA polymerase sigma factor (sigma-70 family)
MNTEKSDTQHSTSLWDDFLSGSDTAYAAIYKEYMGVLYQYGMRFTVDKELIKDCIQDVFTRIYKNRSRLVKVNNLKMYLLFAMKNSLYNSFKKIHNLYQMDSMEPVFSVDYSIEDQIIEREEVEYQTKKMLHILELLTPRQKEVIHYRYVECLSMEEICGIMDMNYQSVQNLIQRSIKKVRNNFLTRK